MNSGASLHNRREPSHQALEKGALSPHVVVVIGRTAAGELRFVPVTVQASANDLQVGNHHTLAMSAAERLGIVAALTAIDEEFAREAISGLRLLSDATKLQIPPSALEQLLEPFTIAEPRADRATHPRE